VDGQTSGGFSRAYLHHLDRCGEMLAPCWPASTTCTTNLNLMREIRAALDAWHFHGIRAPVPRRSRARGVAGSS